MQVNYELRRTERKLMNSTSGSRFSAQRLQFSRCRLCPEHNHLYAIMARPFRTAKRTSRTASQTAQRAGTDRRRNYQLEKKEAAIKQEERHAQARQRKLTTADKKT